MKGVNNYIPKVGEVCLISPPNCDDENGYVYVSFKVLWKDDIFILYGNEGFYPNLNKLEHVSIKELK
jgi:hypothetical protein